MTEPNPTRADSLPASPGSSLPGAGRHPDAARRATHIRRLLAILGAAAIVTIVLDGVLFVLDPAAWQFLALAATTAVPLVLILVAVRLVQENRLDASGYLTLVGITIVLVGNQLFLAGTTVILGVAGALLLVFAGRICLPGRRLLWLALAALYLASGFVIDLLEPLPRYAIGQSEVLNTYVPLIAAFLTLAALGVLIRSYRVGTLRARLLSALIGATLLPVAIIGIGLVLVGVNNERQQVLDRLEAVAILKESQVTRWAAQLKSDLALALAGDAALNQAIRVLDPVGDPAAVEEAREGLRTQLASVIQEAGAFQELLLLDLQGNVVVSTDPAHEGLSYSNQSFFSQGLAGAYVQRPYYSASEMQVYQFAARPFRDPRGEIQAVLAGRTDLSALNDILSERAGLGETGETYLVAAGTMLTPNRAGSRGFYVQSEGIDRALQAHAGGTGRYANYQAVPVLGAYRWLPDLQVALLAEEHQAEARSRISLILLLLAGITLVGVGAAVVASIFLLRSIANPLANLAATAEQVASGNLQLDVAVDRLDEVGQLARAFNVMTARLRELVGSLEERVADRTQALERRSSDLQAAAEVSRAAVSILDPRELMQRVVEQIGQRFDLYYVGLFLVDESGEWAVLRSNAGWADPPLPELGQRLGVGNTSMIGWCIANAQTRNAPEALSDSVRVPRQELPLTRAEAALPLLSRGRVLGALTVQHNRPGAFDADTIAVLQTMVDQIAVALDNARLFAERDAALQAAHRAYGELSREAWAEILQGEAVLGYRASERGVAEAREVWRPEMEQAVQTGQTVRGNGMPVGDMRPLAVPIKVRGQVVGVLDTYKPAEAGDWTPDEIALLEAIAGQLDAALESARLYQGQQRRAAREQAIRHVTDRMRRAVDVEAILQNTVTELANALGARRAYVRLGTDLPAAVRDTEQDSLLLRIGEDQGEGETDTSA